MTPWAVAHNDGAMAKATTDELELVKRADAVARKLRKERSTLSAELFNDGKKLDRLAEGGGVYHSVFKAADAKLAGMERELGLIEA